ncbi:hypothetical protein AYO40_05880 [Planctomycetaceae bacterium SCGC AG-212-D15]|nr:hypothetical protein AYO40_05880 [Planctomycetaceae bacterium SCGC AG-212-D15]
MSTRWPTHCLGAALLLLGIVVLSGAKPPDLPAPVKVDCKEYDAAAPRWRQDGIPAEAAEAEEGPIADGAAELAIDTLYPWLDALMRACEEQVEVWFHELKQADGPRQSLPVTEGLTRASKWQPWFPAPTLPLTLARGEVSGAMLAEVEKEIAPLFKPTQQERTEATEKTGCLFCAWMNDCWPSIGRAAQACCQDVHGCFLGRGVVTASHSVRIVAQGQHITFWASEKTNACRDAADVECRAQALRQRGRSMVIVADSFPDPALTQYLSHEELESLKTATGRTGNVSVEGEITEQKPGRIGAAYVWVPARKSGCPCCAAMKSCWASIVRAATVCMDDFHACFFGNGEAADASESAEPTATPCPDETSVCPFMREKKAESCADRMPAPAASMAATPLENLKKLEQADKFFRRAEQAQAAGHFDQACELYEKVQYVCPGSPLAARAEERVKVLSAVKQAQDFTATAVEKQSHREEPKKPALVTRTFVIAGIKPVRVRVPGKGWTEPYDPSRDGPVEDLLIRLITETIEPETWQANGGAGTIDYFPLGKSLVVTQRADIAELVGKLLTAIRHLQKQEKSNPEPAKGVGSACPYLREKEAAQNAAKSAPPSLGTPLENLQKLTEARKLLDRAQRCADEGNIREAQDLYRQIHELCPGSPLDRMAREQIGQVTPPGTKAAEVIDAKPPCIDEQVAELLEDCQRALADGHYRKAARLARQAQALDPECVAANALVFKAHLLIQVQEKARGARVRTTPVGAVVPLVPHMPEVDPALVQALEQSLAVGADVTIRHHQVDDLMRRYHQCYKEGKYAAAMQLAVRAEEMDPEYVKSLFARPGGMSQRNPAEEAETVPGRSNSLRREDMDCPLHHLLRYVHNKTGVEMEMSARGDLRIHCECHCPTAVFCLTTAADTLDCYLTWIRDVTIGVGFHQ